MAWGLPIVTAVMLFVLLGLYLLRLASALLRDRPTLVRATTDFAWFLMGISWFLVVVFPALLSRWHDKARLGALTGEGPALFDSPWFWQAAYGAYFLAVVVLAGLEFLVRRTSTCLYHLDPSRIPVLMERAAEGLNWRPGAHPGEGSLSPENPGEPPVSHKVAWSPRAPAGVCVIDWGSTPESLRGLLEERLDALMSGEDCGSRVPGMVHFLAAGALITVSLGLSLLQLLGLAGRF